MLNPQRPVMIVDDIKTNLLYITKLLSGAGYDHVVTCQDSRRVPGILAEKQVEIILLDLRDLWANEQP